MERGKRGQYLTRYRATEFTCHRDVKGRRGKGKSIEGESQNVDNNLEIYLFRLLTALVSRLYDSTS